jgi:hypothetical protein
VAARPTQSSLKAVALKRGVTYTAAHPPKTRELPAPSTLDAKVDYAAWSSTLTVLINARWLLGEVARQSAAGTGTRCQWRSVHERPIRLKFLCVNGTRIRKVDIQSVCAKDTWDPAKNTNINLENVSKKTAQLNSPRDFL